MLIQYIRDENRRPIGTMVAIKKDDQAFLGLSFCNLKKDKFNKALGKKIAVQRANQLYARTCDCVNPVIPKSKKRPDYVNQIGDFMFRAERYFHTDYTYV